MPRVESSGRSRNSCRVWYCFGQISDPLSLYPVPCPCQTLHERPNSPRTFLLRQLNQIPCISRMTTTEIDNVLAHVLLGVGHISYRIHLHCFRRGQLGIGNLVACGLFFMINLRQGNIVPVLLGRLQILRFAE